MQYKHKAILQKLLILAVIFWMDISIFIWIGISKYSNFLIFFLTVICQIFIITAYGFITDQIKNFFFMKYAHKIHLFLAILLISSFWIFLLSLTGVDKAGRSCKSFGSNCESLEKL